MDATLCVFTVVYLVMPGGLYEKVGGKVTVGVKIIVGKAGLYAKVYYPLHITFSHLTKASTAAQATHGFIRGSHPKNPTHEFIRGKK